MKVLKRILGVLGTGYTALVVTVLAVRPGEWKDNLNEWGIILGLPLVFAAGIGSVLLVQWWNSRREMEPGNAENVNGAVFSLMTQEDYQKEAESLLEADSARKIVKVFGYTGGREVLDILGTNVEDQRNLEVRFLHRNWLVEREDETQHNSTNPDLPRPWHKSNEIQGKLTESLKQRMRRTFMYYRHQPCIKSHDHRN